MFVRILAKYIESGCHMNINFPLGHQKHLCSDQNLTFLKVLFSLYLVFLYSWRNASCINFGIKEYYGGIQSDFLYLCLVEIHLSKIIISIYSLMIQVHIMNKHNYLWILNSVKVNYSTSKDA